MFHANISYVLYLLVYLSESRKLRDYFLVLQNVQTRSMSPGCLSLRIGGRDVRRVTHRHLVPGLRMSGSIPPLSLLASMACAKTTVPHYGIINYVVHFGLSSKNE